MRLASVLLAGVVAVATAACGDADLDRAADEVEQAASEVASAVEDAAGDGHEPGDDGQDGDGQADDGDRGRDAQNGGQDDDRAQSDDVPVDDLAGVGANGQALLHRSYPRLVIEVDVQDGLEPSSSALDHLRSRIESVADKPGGVGLAGGNSFRSDRETWTADDLRAVAEANRDTRSGGDTVSVYVLYVRGEFEDDEAIGVAYNASEFAVFPERWEDVVGGLTGGTQDVERAVLVHEIGHLFGLVNLTYESRFDRESDEHPGHSENKESVMYYAVETTAIGQVFSGPPPDDFDDADRADLDFIRTGSY